MSTPTSAMMAVILVEVLGSRAALIDIPSGLSPVAFAFEIAERTAASLRDTRAPSITSAFALRSPATIFLLIDLQQVGEWRKQALASHRHPISRSSLEGR
jgi:hypothetical protein